MKEIDLHGLTHNEAIEVVTKEVTSLFVERGFKIKVITGNSVTLQKKIFKEIVERYNLNSYLLTNNLGTIIITDLKL